MTMRLDDAEEAALWDQVMAYLKGNWIGFDPARVPRREFVYDGDTISLNIDADMDDERMTVVNPKTLRLAA